MLLTRIFELSRKSYLSMEYRWKSGNFCRQTHNVNFDKVNKISAILWKNLLNTAVKRLLIG